IARKYFGSVNVVGQTLTFNDNTPFKVTGVIKNIPRQSHFHFDFFMSMPTILKESTDDGWLYNNFNTYVLLKPGVNFQSFGAKMPEFLHRHAAAQLQSVLHMDFAAFEKSGNNLQFTLTPLKNIH